MFKKLLILMGTIAFLMVVIFVIKNTGTRNSAVSDYDEELVDALRVGVHHDIKKMGYREYYEDEVKGFEIDLAKQLAKHLYGKESLIELTNVSNKTAKHYLDNKTIDAVIATQTPPEEKLDAYKFSDPYYTDFIECVYTQGNIMSINDLAGKKIGVITDSPTHVKLKQLLKDAKVEVNDGKAEANDGKAKVTFVPVESYPDGLDAVNAGKIDGFCINRVYLPAGNLKRFTLGECKYSIMVRAADTELLKKINDAIKSLSDSGELSVLVDQWK